MIFFFFYFALTGAEDETQAENKNSKTNFIKFDLSVIYRCTI